MSAQDNLSPKQFGMEVDHDAPNYFPEGLKKNTVVIQPTDHVVATQRGLDPEHPAFKNYDKKKAEKGGGPNLVDIEGVLHINDGHHRIAAARKLNVPIKSTVWHE